MAAGCVHDRAARACRGGDISHDGRSRRRRAIPADQLALALDGQLDQVFAVSFIITNISIFKPGHVVDIEDHIRDTTGRTCLAQAKVTDW